MQLFLNNWSSTLASAALAADGTLSISAGDAALLTGLGTGDHYLLTLVEVDQDGNEIDWEVVKVTGNNAGTLTVVRGHERAARDWDAGTALTLRVTAATLGGLRDNGGAPLSDALPQALGAAAAGTSPDASRSDHAHALPTPGDIGAATSAQGAKADTAVQPAALTAALADKVDKVVGYGLSATDFTQAEKDKLAALESSRWKGNYASLAALQTAHPSGSAGDYADVDGGVGVDVVRYIWDATDSDWKAGGGGGGSMTPAEIKTSYESNADTNAFSDAEKTKLAGVAAGATANANTDSLSEGATNLYHTAARVRAALLTGLSLAVGTAVAATDTVLEAFGKLQKQVNDLVTSVAGKQATLVSGTNIKTVNGSSLLGPGDLTVGGGTSLPVVQTFTGNKTLALADINKWSRSQDGTAQAVTLPAQATVAWTADAEIHLEQGAAGAVTITAAAGVSINGVTAGSFSLAGQYAAATLKRTSADNWTLLGSLSGLGSAGDWCTYGGTANAITLTPSGAPARAAYRAGDAYRFRATATNTGATTVNVAGLGAKTVVTVTGAALPAGYIRTDVHTLMTYDAAGDRFVADRQIERGSNANGEYVRYADGTQICQRKTNTGTDTIGINVPSTSFTKTWTYPAAFVFVAAHPVGEASLASGSAPIKHSVRLRCDDGTSSASYTIYTDANMPTASYSYKETLYAVGRWF